MPATLDPAQSDCIIGTDDPDGASAREAAQRLVPEIAAEGDDRDWRSRTALPDAPAGTAAPSEAPPPRRAPPSDGAPKVCSPAPFAGCCSPLTERTRCGRERHVLRTT